MDEKEREKYYYSRRPIPDKFKYCSDCGIIRTKSPTPGTCPCCFSEMTHKKGYQGNSISVCTNEPCKLCISTSQLTGFWHGWKEKEREVNFEWE